MKNKNQISRKIFALSANFFFIASQFSGLPAFAETLSANQTGELRPVQTVDSAIAQLQAEQRAVATQTQSAIQQLTSDSPVQPLSLSLVTKLPKKYEDTNHQNVSYLVKDGKLEIYTQLGDKKYEKRVVDLAGSNIRTNGDISLIKVSEDGKGIVAVTSSNSIYKIILADTDTTSEKLATLDAKTQGYVKSIEMTPNGKEPNGIVTVITAKNLNLSYVKINPPVTVVSESSIAIGTGTSVKLFSDGSYELIAAGTSWKSQSGKIIFPDTRSFVSTVSLEIKFTQTGKPQVWTYFDGDIKVITATFEEANEVLRLSKFWFDYYNYGYVIDYANNVFIEDRSRIWEHRISYYFQLNSEKLVQEFNITKDGSISLGRPWDAPVTYEIVNGVKSLRVKADDGKIYSTGVDAQDKLSLSILQKDASTVTYTILVDDQGRVSLDFHQTTVVAEYPIAIGTGMSVKLFSDGSYELTLAGKVYSSDSKGMVDLGEGMFWKLGFNDKGEVAAITIWNRGGINLTNRYTLETVKGVSHIVKEEYDYTYTPQAGADAIHPSLSDFTAHSSREWDYAENIFRISVDNEYGKYSGVQLYTYDLSMEKYFSNENNRRIEFSLVGNSIPQEKQFLTLVYNAEGKLIVAQHTGIRLVKYPNGETAYEPASYQILPVGDFDLKMSKVISFRDRSTGGLEIVLMILKSDDKVIMINSDITATDGARLQLVGSGGIWSTPAADEDVHRLAFTSSVSGSYLYTKTDGEGKMTLTVPQKDGSQKVYDVKINAQGLNQGQVSLTLQQSAPNIEVLKDQLSKIQTDFYDVAEKAALTQAELEKAYQKTKSDLLQIRSQKGTSGSPEVNQRIDFAILAADKAFDIYSMQIKAKATNRQSLRAVDVQALNKIQQDFSTWSGEVNSVLSRSAEKVFASYDHQFSLHLTAIDGILKSLVIQTRYAHLTATLDTIQPGSDPVKAWGVLSKFREDWQTLKTDALRWNLQALVSELDFEASQLILQATWRLVGF